MKNSHVFMPAAQRISSFEPYFFASLGKKINQLKQQGMDIIRIDMGRLTSHPLILLSKSW